MMVNENWPLLLEPGLRAIFELQYQALIAESRIPMLFNVLTSNKAQEKDFSVGGMDDWQEYKGAIEYEEPEAGFPNTYEHTEYARGIMLQRKLVDDDQYNVINRRVQQLALTAARTREEHAVGVFNRAFSSAKVGGDGVALVSTSHPMSPTNTGTVQSNKGTTAFSYDALINTRKVMREFKDDRGKLTPINPDTILIPPELEDVVWTTLFSMNKPGGSLNDANFLKGRGYNVITWDYLTDSNNWFVLDSGLMKQFLLWFDRVPLEFAVDPTGTYNLVARYRGYMRYSFGWSDWRWIYGHEVA